MDAYAQESKTQRCRERVFASESVYAYVCMGVCVRESEREEETVSEKVVSQTQSGLRKEFD